MERLDYPDHHPFDAADAERIRRAAADRPVVMTRKEAVKLRPLLSADVDARMSWPSGWRWRRGQAELDRALREAVAVSALRTRPSTCWWSGPGSPGSSSR